MRNLLVILSLFYLVCQTNAQNRYVNWFFASGAGIKFGASGPSVQSGGQTSTEEGVATMSDPCGNLLFYSDGTKIWNKKHNVMTNGSGLNGHIQSAEAVLIVPKPASDSLYYVFTTYSYGGTNGVQYNIVDMSKQSGDGEVISKNNKLYGKSSEKLCAVLHQNQSSYWILTHDWDSSKYKVFLLTDAGLNTIPVISVLGPTTKGNVETALGHIRPSPDGKKVASTFWYQGRMDIYDFNNSTGRLTLDTSLTNFAHARPYSVEFSPNNNVLYVGEAATSSDNDIYQFNLTAGNIGASRNKVTTASGYRIGNFNLGADGKFYVSRFNQNYLGVISNPDTYGSSVNFTANGFSLGSQTAKLGLPNQIYPIFITTPNYNIYTKVGCSISTPVKFDMSSNSCYDSLVWDFADTGKNNTSRLRKPTHTYSKKGKYNVTMTVYNKGNLYKITKKIKVPMTPDINLGSDTLICGTIDLTLIGADTAQTYLWNDNSKTATKNVKSVGKYWVKSTLDGCSAYDTITISNSTIIAGYAIDTLVQCQNYNSFKLKNTSTYKFDSIISKTWKLSDNTTYNDSIVKKSFATADSFLVKLVIVSKNGCKDSVTKKVYVNPNTNIDFRVNRTPQCFIGHEFVLTDSSKVSAGKISKYSWNFGDGNTDTLKNISSKKYNKDSSYYVTLITTTDKGCKDTLTKTVVIHPNPQTDYSINKITQCHTYNSYNYTNSSRIRTGKIASQLWAFGDSKTDTARSITGKKYATADSFAVLLLNISDYGCRDSLSKKVYVDPNTSIGFSINKTPQCFDGHDFVYTNSSTVAKGTMSQDWRFGDGNSATTKDVTSKKYGIDSTYQVTLITTTDKGCKDTIVKTIVVNPNPKIGYSINQTIQCHTFNLYDFTNSSTIRTGSIAKNLWDFGDSKTDTTKNISAKKYSTADTFSVQLLTISDKGCRDSLTQIVIINPNTSIGFSINKTPQCFNGHDFVYTNSSTVSKGTITYDWRFGDGNNSTTKDISSKQYGLDSTYIITLVTTTDKGCKDTIAKSVTVYPSPKAGFGMNQAVQCFKWNLFDYTNSSSIRTGSIATNAWNLGDADTRTTKDIYAKYYTTEDSFKVSLLTISNNGCRDSISKWAYILNTPKPSFAINQDTQCFNEHAFDFKNNTTIGGGNFTTRWEFGDATTSTNLDITQKKYATFGNYKVLQITTSDKNCKDSLQKSICIHASPDTKFNIDKDRQCFKGNVFNFTNPSSIPEGTITYSWSLGEGKTSTSKDVMNHKYTTEDTFNVRLITTSDKGCKDTLTKMAVTFAQPVAKFVVPEDSQCWQKHYFIIINNTTLKYGTLNHVWDFGDGTKDFTHTPQTKRYANKSADYVLRYKVTSDHGCTDSAQKKVSLLERPIAEFTINDSIQCFRTNNYSFVNKTSFSDLSTITYFWDYGDGSKTTGKIPKSLSYPTANYYTVSLIAHSYLNNCVDTLDKIIVVAPHATPDYTIDNDSQCLRTNKFTYTNLSKVKFGTLKYNWNFGDNTKDTASHPIKKYTGGSNYSVKMVATTNYNCKDSVSKPIVIIPHPKSGFTVADSTLCKVQSLNITNNTTLLYGTFTQVWRFDEGSDQTGFNVSGKKLVAPGFHPIRLAVISNFGCTDTITKKVFVEQSGTTKISIVENDSQCLRGNKTQFNVFSQGGTINLSGYTWQFGDGNSSNVQKPTHTYAVDSSFKISAETVSSNGCLDTAYFAIVIHPHPVSDFSANTPCYPNPVDFTNLSTIKSGSITSQSWDLGNLGVTSPLVNPTIQYPSSGSYTVKLKNYSNYGCTDSVIKPAVVMLKPTAMFSYTQVPSPDEIRLQMNNESSLDATTHNWDLDEGNASQNINPLAIYKDSGRFTIVLEVINDAGCRDTFSVKTGLFYPEFVIYLPNVFSPNGNGINDVFKPGGSQYNRDYTLEIFNRWGERVFLSYDVTHGWDGTYKGEDCQDGIYYCYLRVMPMKGPLKSYYTYLRLLR